MRDSAFIVATALYVGAIGFAYLNRDSEKVITTLFLGVTALIGSIVAVILFSSQPPLRKAFSVPIIIHGDTRFPFEGLPYPVLPMEFAIRIREKLAAHPELLPESKTDPFAQSVYHHALQRAMIYWLESKYPTTWQTDMFPMTLGETSGYSFQSKQVRSRVYLPVEVRALMSGNQFADIEGIFGHSGNFGLALPEGTVLSVATPHLDPSQGEVSRITLRNRFCTITVELRRAMSTVGAGSYRMLLGMSQEQAQKALKSDLYTVRNFCDFQPPSCGKPGYAKLQEMGDGYN